MKLEKPLDPNDKKEFLLLAAGALFAEHGFEGTSVRMISEKSGMNVAMISYYFGSKEKLFEELIISKTNYMREHLTSILDNPKLDPWMKIELMIEGYTERILKTGGAFHKLMMREITLGQRSEISKAIEERIMFNMKAVYSIIQEGIKKKVFHKDIDFPMLMSTMIGTITQTLSSHRMFCSFHEMEGVKYPKKIDVNVQSARVKKHLKKIFAYYLLVHPEKYKF